MLKSHLYGCDFSLGTTMVSKAPDDQGNEIIPELNFIENTVR